MRSNKSTRRRAIGILAIAAVLASCGHGPPPPEAHEIERPPVDLAAPVERANAAIRDLQQRLAKRLMAEMGRGGPVAAVGVCREEAPAISASVAKEQRVAVGRTSHRLRNPQNAPPPWARAYVDAAGGKKAADVAGVAFDLGDRVGVLRPISTGGVCTKCHGPSHRISPELREAIHVSYPEDQATGFAPGDLRGFFWAEAAK